MSDVKEDLFEMAESILKKVEKLNEAMMYLTTNLVFRKNRGLAIVAEIEKGDLSHIQELKKLLEVP